MAHRGFISWGWYLLLSNCEEIVILFGDKGEILKQMLKGNLIIFWILECVQDPQTKVLSFNKISVWPQ